MMTWTVWLKGLAAAALGGAASGAVTALGSGQINQNTAVTAAIGALTTVLAYLTKSPLASQNGTAPQAPGASSTPSAT